LSALAAFPFAGRKPVESIPSRRLAFGATAPAANFGVVIAPFLIAGFGYLPLSEPPAASPAMLFKDARAFRERSTVCSDPFATCSERTLFRGILIAA
jgi:hypothetical protein